MSESDDATTSAGSAEAPRTDESAIGSGTHGPTYNSRRACADVSRSMATRVVTVVNHAASLSITERSVRCQRIHTSWTTSSASSGVPVMR